MPGNFSAGSFSGAPGGFSTDPVASNWQHPSSGQPTREEIHRQRIALGIEEEVRQAVQQAAEAAERKDSAVDREAEEAAARLAQAAEQAYLAAYREALREELLAAEILEQFRIEVQARHLLIKRRAALLLLLS